LKLLLLDPDRACKLGQEGREGMQAYYDVKKTAADFMILLEKTIDSQAVFRIAL